MPSSNWVPQYDCVCGKSLKSVTKQAIEAHLNGERHRVAMNVAPDFQDFTCGCGRKVVYVKEAQIIQHQESRDCRLKIQTLQQTSLLEHLVEPVPRSFAFAEEDQEPSEVQHPAARDSRLQPSPEEEGLDEYPALCPGFLPPQIAKAIFHSHYPFAVHREGGVPNCPAISWLPGLNCVYSIACTSVVAPGKSLCQYCDLLQGTKALRDVIDYAMTAAPKSDYLRLGIQQLADLLHSARQNRNTHNLRTLSLQRQVFSLRGESETTEKLIVAMRTGQYARIGQFLDVHMQKGRSLKFCIGLLEQAVGPMLTRKYTEREYDLALLVYRLGGSTLLFSFNKAGLLPSSPFSKDFARMPNPFNLRGNLDVTGISSLLAHVWRSLPRVPIGVHWDEVSLLPRLTVQPLPGHKGPFVVGLCEHGPELLPYVSIETIKEVIRKLIAKEWHLATHCKITGVTRHDKYNFRLIPVSFEVSCNRFTGLDEEVRMRALHKLWDPLAPIFGPLRGLNSDADSRRIWAFIRLLSHVAPIDPPLLLFDGALTEFNETITADRRHIDKRLRYQPHPCSIARPHPRPCSIARPHPHPCSIPRPHPHPCSIPRYVLAGKACMRVGDTVVSKSTLQRFGQDRGDPSAEEHPQPEG